MSAKIKSDRGFGRFGMKISLKPPVSDVPRDKYPNFTVKFCEVPLAALLGMAGPGDKYLHKLAI